MKAARSVARVALFGLMVGLAGSAQAATDLHLLGDRFRVSADWRTADGVSGTATAVPLTGETGLFWFFSPGNVELVVKVLDACVPPFERFWVYASGLTDVEVDLTVEDTWTGQSKTYLRPRGSLFAPLADTGTFNGCGAPPPAPSCGRGTAEEIAATPRSNAEAEELALFLGQGITADPGIYARLADELARIRGQWPLLQRPIFVPLWDPFYLIVQLEPDAYAAVVAGVFSAWNCLNDWYGARVINVHPSSMSVSIEFKGRFHPVRLGVDYADLPGVVKVEPALMNNPQDPGGVFNDICATIDGPAYDYFLRDREFVYYFRVPQPGATPLAFGYVSPVEPRPSWWPSYLQCELDLANAAYQ